MKKRLKKALQQGDRPGLLNPLLVQSERPGKVKQAIRYLQIHKHVIYHCSFQDVITTGSETNTRKRKALPVKVTEGSVEDVSISPVVRITRRSQLNKQVVLLFTFSNEYLVDYICRGQQ